MQVFIIVIIKITIPPLLMNEYITIAKFNINNIIANNT